MSSPFKKGDRVRAVRVDPGKATAFEAHGIVLGGEYEVVEGDPRWVRVRHPGNYWPAGTSGWDPDQFEPAGARPRFFASGEVLDEVREALETPKGGSVVERAREVVALSVALGEERDSQMRKVAEAEGRTTRMGARLLDAEDEGDRLRGYLREARRASDLLRQQRDANAERASAAERDVVRLVELEGKLAKVKEIVAPTETTPRPTRWKYITSVTT